MSETAETITTGSAGNRRRSSTSPLRPCVPAFSGPAAGDEVRYGGEAAGLVQRAGLEDLRIRPFEMSDGEDHSLAEQRVVVGDQHLERGSCLPLAPCAQDGPAPEAKEGPSERQEGQPKLLLPQFLERGQRCRLVPFDRAPAADRVGRQDGGCRPPSKPERHRVRQRSQRSDNYCVAAGRKPALAAPSRIAASAPGAVTGKSRM